MAKKRNKSAHRRFMGIPRCVMESDSYARTTGPAAKLLTYIANQYNSYNNGNLTAIWQDFGEAIGSVNTFRKALKNLLDNRLIEITGTGTTKRKGGRPPTLYAVTWECIDEYRGKGHMTAIPCTNPIRNDWDKPNKSKNSKILPVSKSDTNPLG